MLSAAAALALTSCGDGSGDEDTDGATSGGDPGTLLGEEYLGHQLRDVTESDAPSLNADVTEDSHGGWNVHLETDAFEFTPEQLDGDAVGNQGHAHIYVGDTKFSRVYSEWFYLPASAVSEGEHTLTLTLNADDHSVWAVDSEPITATATVTGQDSGGHEHSHGDDTGDQDTTGAGQENGDGDDVPGADHIYTYGYEITDGRAEPPLEQKRVELGSVVRIVVTSDVADEIHLHGYDVSAEIPADESVEIEFTADQQGQFELETHETGLTLLQLLVE